ncbi:MAG: helix-turn-helix domain-containing protein [Acetobacteraceae bacterium]
MVVSIQNVTTYSVLVARLVGELRRARSSLDQKQFAEKLGVSQSTWSRAEAGQVGLSLDQLAAAADVLGVKPAQILAHAETAIEHLKRRGVTVLIGKDAAKDDQSFAYLGAAALGALVAAILAKGK